jgi:hypothetical protein
MEATVRTVPLYLSEVERTRKSLAEEESFTCLQNTAARIDDLFRLPAHEIPLTLEMRTCIVLHEWIREGCQVTLPMIRRAKSAILKTGVYCLINGMAQGWAEKKVRPVRPLRRVG